MYRQLSDFLDDLTAESAATLAVVRALDDAEIPASIAERRDPREVAWHICQSYGSILGQVEIQLGAPASDDAAPEVATIAERYRAIVATLRTRLSDWSDHDLELTDDVYGQPWRRGHTLAILLRHEVHHRGQITALLRLAGGRVPATYGPSADER